MTLAPRQSSRFIEPENLPPSPIYVFRGHVAEITAVEFIRNDSRLVSGDADGWLVVWNLTTRRPCAVWKGHTASVLSVREGGGGKLITHGRDGNVIIWQLDEENENNLEKGLPADGGERRQPEVLESFSVKEMTFCGIDTVIEEDVIGEAGLPNCQDILFAACSGNLGELVDIHSVSKKEIVCSAVGKEPPQKLGMTMCLSFEKRENELSLWILVAGYESGHTCVYTISSSSWSTMYSFKAHTQPVLSIAIHPSQESLYTTSADANIVQHPIAIASNPIKSVNTKHSGQTSIRIRTDGRIFVTAGWDGVGRVYSSTTLKQVAVLKWHLGGLQAAEFAQQKRWIILGGKDGKPSLWDVFT